MPALLPLLTETFQSGEALARRLGVSRAAVHKEARRLRAEGYPVEVSREGYRLSPGAPAPHLLSYPYPFHYLGRVDSTQDVLRGLARSGAPEGSLVLAEVQEKGRGRRGRVWLSEPGKSLTFSLLLKPSLPLSGLGLLPLLAGVALAEAVGVGGLKWPNDLLSPDGRKMAGVLLEAEVQGEEVAFALLGVGINVLSAPSGAAALAEWGFANRREVLARFLERFFALYPLLFEPQALLDRWRERSLTLGRRVRVVTPKGLVEGVAEEVLPDGSLLV
ncbi:MAG: biotin--[acetyl-CoA-carboxylase] ligase, partial [Thermus sp.]|uniref:biotin--[acetyl-CoA-carboxylase] ligase n=1 Tax=Thermus sp. TaxID=275 RepID=UPI00332C69F8